MYSKNLLHPIAKVLIKIQAIDVTVQQPSTVFNEHDQVFKQQLHAHFAC